MSILLDEIERIIDTLPDELKEELTKILQERTQKGSVLDKLKRSMDSEEAAKILLLNKTEKSYSGLSCSCCGIRELCAYYREDPTGYDEIKDCVGGIAKTLDSKFKWGEVFYDAIDKYGPDYEEKSSEVQILRQRFAENIAMQAAELAEREKKHAAGAAQDTAGEQ